MAYSKPEIAVLDDAVRAIQSIPDQKDQSTFEAGTELRQVNPAYDLDE